MNYYEVDCTISPLLPAREVLVAELAELGFESFAETDNGLKAYIREDVYAPEMLDQLMAKEIPDQILTMEVNLIPDQNWNAEWEKNFDPIIVDEQCLIRAPFHLDLKKYPFEIIIEPKMSFGTGHHETTHLMIGEMLKMDFTGKKVLDMGSGTGVLAILAAMRHATAIDAIDIDEWAFENSVENVERNSCTKINVIQGGAESIPADTFYDVILANINRNILVRDMSAYNNALQKNGEILFSGFYVMDKPELDVIATQFGWKLCTENNKGEWCMLHYFKA